MHPLGLEYNEVLARLKTKKYESLIKDPNGVFYTKGLPHLSQDEMPELKEYTLLVSSLDFEVEDEASASMRAIMKTIESLYFLGKITHLNVRKKSAVIKPPSVPAPILNLQLP